MQVFHGLITVTNTYALNKANVN